MEHTSLYRKYRPQSFDDVLGQEHVTRTLQNALKTTPPSLVHAFLFCGPRGTGKTTTARLLAKAINCAQGPTPTPCGDCGSCLDITRGSAMDVLEIDAASNTGVDNVREVIISKVSFKPALGRYRMYIIDEAHQLSNHAFNALLKTIEEPPSHAMFVLATTEYQKIPATISSRCQRHIFHHISDQHIAERVRQVAKREGVVIEGGAVHALARAAEGGLRDALSLLEQMIAYAGTQLTEESVHAMLGTVSREELAGLLESLEAGDAATALKLARDLRFRGISAASTARAIATFIRDRVVDDLQQRTTTHQTQRLHYVELFARAESDMRWNASHDLVLDLALLKACLREVIASAAPSPAPLPIAAPRSRPVPLTATASPPSVPATPTRVAAAAAFAAIWPQVLDAVKQQGGAPLHAKFKEGAPLALEGDTLIVAFGQDCAFHHRMCNEEPRRKVIESVLRTFTAAFPPTVRLECRVAEAAPTASANDLVADAIDLFGATVVQ